MMVLAVVALLLYGGRLPEMARTWGKALAEFRRSLSGIQSEFNDALYSTRDQLEYYPEKNVYDDQSINETSGYDEPPPDEVEDEAQSTSVADSLAAENLVDDSGSPEPVKRTDVDCD
ncbi:MAG: twin-arginine translocase TatA/TatE family subunit [Planctomycetales bacterium]|nr:twin-arginine translocase TatA/TatE family subunit [Planctomycetales bacterium]